MICQLAERFRTNPGNILPALSEHLGSKYHQVSILIVGAGDAFIQRYWPHLRQYVNRRKVILSVADRGSLEELVEVKTGKLAASNDPDLIKIGEKIKSQYAEFQQFIKAGKAVQYFNLLGDEGSFRYDQLHTADIVFVLVPDHVHLLETRKWLRRAELIFVEKPYASTHQEAEDFAAEYESIRESEKFAGDFAAVVPFDHCLAKVFEYMRSETALQLPEHIGRMQSIDFSFTESKPPESHRIETLSRGLIADLYPHILSLLSLFANLDAIDQDGRKLSVSRLDGSGIEKETFARIESYLPTYTSGVVPIDGMLGKGIGEHDEKYMLVRGSKGSLLFNFARHPSFGEPTIAIVPQEGLNPDIVRMNSICTMYTSGHMEFIQQLLSGKYLQEPCGGLLRSQAHQILLELDRLGRAVDTLPAASMPTYKPRTPRQDIPVYSFSNIR